jgi:uracil-DNA glycosylase
MNSRQLHYLKAMDIDVWVRREFDERAAVSEASAQMAVLDHPRASAASSGSASHAGASWEQLAESVRTCTRCELHGTRTQTVFGVGNHQAEWMIIGEAPGADEDRQGEPFVGRAGQLLNSMLKAMGFPREQVYIANILKCRPPGNRDPRPEEAACCAPYLARQIELVNPRVILCVGRIAAQNLLNTDTPIGKLRGQVHRLGAQQRPVVVTYHPAYLLRSPGEKRKAWQDLQFALQVHAQTAERSS